MARRRGRKKKIAKILQAKENSFKAKLYKIIPLVILILDLYLFFLKDFPIYNNDVFMNGLLPLNIIFFIIVMGLLSFSSDNLTDNVMANKVLAPFIFIIFTFYLNWKTKLPWIYNDLDYFYGSLGAGVVFVVIYLYSSSYFQPDLDLSGNRPGMTHFPTGKWVTKYRIGRFFKWICNTSPYTVLINIFPEIKNFKKKRSINIRALPFNIIHPLKFLYKILDLSITSFWYNLWTPFASLLTHRGIGHWPILSVWLRIAYLYLILSLISYFIYVDPLLKYLKMFFPWDKNFMSLYWFVICLPVYLSDFVHIAVDFMDSVRSGKPFCSKSIPRGLLSQIFLEKKKKKR